MGELLGRSLAQHVDEFTLGGGVESLPKFDYEVSLISLPLLFDTREDTIPTNVPYLYADPMALNGWCKRLAKEKRLKVGLVWTGSHGHQRNPYRRVGLERYVDYFREPDDVAFYSLQPGAGADVAAARTAGLDIAEHTSEFKTFDDTAAYIGALDLVITVCTLVAHLSGAIGQRTWVLLDLNPHWVWLLDRRDSPWYPTASLYRQPQFGQWEPVFDEATRDLAALANARLRSSKGFIPARSARLARPPSPRVRGRSHLQDTRDTSTRCPLAAHRRAARASLHTSTPTGRRARRNQTRGDSAGSVHWTYWRIRVIRIWADS